MDPIGESIHLESTDVYITEGPKDAFRVVSGTVMIYVAPLKAGQPGRRLLLCEIGEGKLFPSLAYRDASFREWRFLITPRETAELERMPGKATSVLYRKFARAAELASFAQEGFENGVVEHYEHETLKDNVFIGRGKKDEPNVNIASYGVIREAFEARDDRIIGDDPLYKAVVFACGASRIPVAEAEKIAAVYGDEVTVSGIAHLSRFACRSVVLSAGWERRDSGTIISHIEDEPVACVTNGSRYTIYYGQQGRRERLTPEIAATVSPEAHVISRTLPGESISRRELIAFARNSIKRLDLFLVALLGLVGVLIGILIPTLNQKIYDDYIPLGNIGQLTQICFVIASFMVGSLFFDVVKRLTEFRIGSRVGYDVQNAVYYRVFHLPESFFRDYESADLAQRIGQIAGYVQAYVGLYVVSGLAAVFSLLYLYKMFRYSSKLTWMALLMMAVYGALLFFLSVRSMRYSREIESCKGRASGRLYQYLTGVEKIRMAGVEDRAAYQYLLPFSEKQTAEIRKNRYDAALTMLSGSISVLFSMVFYLVIVRSKIDITTGAFMAFNSAFGAFFAAFAQLIRALTDQFQRKPQYERFRPVLECPIEDDVDCEVPERLQGGVSLDHVVFSYGESGVNVLNGVDVNIRPGEYIGIVGPSGCGKSTLLKLLLGFERPKSGQICYDGRDIKTLDKRALRKNLGVVLQNGKLISGSIYENITITAPGAKMADVKAVIRAVGLEEDIAQMPMGIHTVLSENSGTISGGQQQRILIARAIISRPSVLIFDEATSALDNLTQAAVCESLDRMNVTRIVVAHRLSTIKNCDRILVLNEGRIAEEGNYETLMAMGGLFAQLGSRQLVD